MGHLKEGLRSFEERRPKFEEGCTEVSIREGPEERTLRTEEVGSKTSCINVDHIAEDRWEPLLVDADWHASCHAICKGVEGSDWRELYEHYKEMSRAAGVRVPSESQKKARALWKLKAAKDRREDFYDQERKAKRFGKK